MLYLLKSVAGKLFVALGCVAWAAAGALSAPPLFAAENALVLAIEHVTVLRMVPGEAPLRDATVVLENGRIVAVGNSSAVKIPAGALRIAGEGKWLMPALADAHVHSQNFPDSGISDADIFLPYVANGILQIVNFSASVEALQLRGPVESGELLAPHMAFCGLIDGFPPARATLRIAKTPEEGRAYVREIKAAGYDFVKTYSRLTLETFIAIVDESRRLGIPAIGHIPERGKGQFDRMIVPGFTTIAHAEELAYQVPDYQTKGITDGEIPHFVELAQRNHTGLVSTMVVMESILRQVVHPEVLQSAETRYLPPQVLDGWLHRNAYLQRANDTVWIARIASVGDFNPKLIRAFVAAGIPVLAGTDAPLPGLVPGFSLHDELELLAKAGLTNEQVLASATRLPARWLGVDQDRGTVESGKRADLLLLDADPLADVANTRKIAAVFAGARYLPRAELDRMMAELAARFAARPAKKPSGPGTESARPIP